LWAQKDLLSQLGGKMALQKIDVLALGRGSLTDNSQATIIFTANNTVSTYDNSATYSQYNVVEYNNKVYRSKINGNLGNQPDISPNQWETLYNNVKDGDMALVVNGALSMVLQRVNGIWTSITGLQITINLNDGQAVPADAIVFLGSSKTWAKLEYTIKRGVGEGRKRKGLMNILNDGVNTVEYDHRWNEIGLDVNANLDVIMIGGNVHVQYTSVNEGVPITMKYQIRGWSG